MTITRHHQNVHMSKYVVHGGIIYMSGQVADDPSQDFEGQLQQILDKIDRQLAEAGSDRTQILRAMVWIDDYRKWGRLNTLWDAWTPDGSKPARSCVEAKLAFPEYQVEIEVTAVQGSAA